MSERKQTPDILAEILGGTLIAQETRPSPPAPAALPAAKRANKSVKPTIERTRPVKNQLVEKPESPHWEHRVASFQEHKGWRLRFVDGAEVAGWAGGMTLCEYIDQASRDGWQVAGACAGQPMFGVLDKYQVFLKRSAT